MALVIVWRTTKLVEGGHRGLYVFSKSKKSWILYVFCRVSCVFSNYDPQTGNSLPSGLELIVSTHRDDKLVITDNYCHSTREGLLRLFTSSPRFTMTYNITNYSLLLAILIDLTVFWWKFILKNYAPFGKNNTSAVQQTHYKNNTMTQKQHCKANKVTFGVKGQTSTNRSL